MTGAGHGPSVVAVVAASEPDVGEVEARILETAGYEAVRITDGATIPEAVSGSQAAVVVLDLFAANVDCLAALRRSELAGASATRAVVIGTGPASAELAWREGADAVLTRPFPATELVEVVAAVLARADGNRAAVRSEAIGGSPAS